MFNTNTSPCRHPNILVGIREHFRQKNLLKEQIITNNIIVQEVNSNETLYLSRWDKSHTV